MFDLETKLMFINVYRNPYKNWIKSLYTDKQKKFAKSFSSIEQKLFLFNTSNVKGSVDLKYWFKSFDIQLEPTNQNSIKVPKVVVPTNKKKLL